MYDNVIIVQSLLYVVGIIFHWMPVLINILEVTNGYAVQAPC